MDKEYVKCIESLKKCTISEKKTEQYIFTPCKIPDFIDINELKKYVKQDVDSNIEYFNDMNTTYRISEPIKAEWMLSKSIKDCKRIGNGNTNVDICKDDIGIDVCVLTLNGNTTNEKSIMQNFSSGDNLDILFKELNGEDAVNIYKEKLINKYKNCKYNKFYYIAFICKNKNIYLSCLELNVDRIQNMKFNKFSTNKKSIHIGNFIDSNIGNVRLYQSKKRLELRLNKQIITRTCSELIY